jgi:hypothetical protein
VNPEQRRGEYLRHHITHLSLYLREYADDSIEFEGSSSKFRTEENDDYEYTLTIAANDVPLMRAALGVGPGVDVYDTIVARAEEIVTRGESAWMKERDVPFSFFAWAPWVSIVPDEEPTTPAQPEAPQVTDVPNEDLRTLPSWTRSLRWWRRLR